MKETIKINLNNQLFDLDNDAYERLKQYLDSLRTKFSTTPEEANEIVEDIESRIAEILQQKISKTKQVITLADIDEIISLIGTPEEMEEPETEEAQQSSTDGSKKSWQNTSKRLYRDPLNNIFGGVCSGLGAYFNMDPVWIRLIFVLLFFFNLAGLIIYAVLWIVLTPAYSTEQRLEMQGKKFTVNDIEDNVKREYEKVKQSVKNIPNSQAYKKAESGLSEFFRVMGDVLIVFIKVIAIIVLVSLVIGVISAILGLVIGGAAFLPWHIFDHWNWNFWWIDWPGIGFFEICLFLVIAIPIIAIIGKLFRAILNIKSPNRFAAGIGSAVWVLAFISLIVLWVVEDDRAIFKRSKTTEYMITANEGKTLYIGLKNSFSGDIEYYHIFDRKYMVDEKHNDFLKKPGLEIVPSSGNKATLEITRTLAYFSENSSRITDLIDYNWRYTDSMLVLDRYYSYDKDDFWRSAELKLKLKVPEDQEVVVNKSFYSEYIETIKEAQNKYSLDIKSTSMN